MENKKKGKSKQQRLLGSLLWAMRDFLTSYECKKNFFEEKIISKKII